MTRQHCSICGNLHRAKPNPIFKYPSGACEQCRFQVWAAALSKPEPDWGAAIRKNPGYWEPESMVIQ